MAHMMTRIDSHDSLARLAWLAGSQFCQDLRVTPCAARTIISQKESLNYLIASFTRCTLPFQYICFLLPICLPCVSCGTYCNAHKCCVVTHRAADIRLAWLVLNSCLRSHVLRAHCNFQSKQANLITLFGRSPNNNRTNCLGEKIVTR